MNNIDNVFQFVIIADDLTGASDTGIQFCKHGFKTFVVVDHLNINLIDIMDYDVVSINANSRILNLKDAYDRVYSLGSWFKKMSIGLIYKKVDSVMRGNPGIELEGLMDAVEADIAIVAPSFPKNSRVLKNGYLYVDDIVKGMEKCYVPEIFQKEMKRKVENISLNIVRKGESFLKEYILSKINEQIKVFVIDSETDNDLNIVAKASILISQKIVLCGSAGLAHQVPCVWDFKASTNNFNNEKPSGIKLLVAGSRNICTAKQIKELLDMFQAYIIKINTKKIMQNRIDEVISDIIKEVKNNINNNIDIIIVAVDSLFKDNNKDLNNLKFNGEDTHFAQLIVNVIGDAVREIFKRFKIKSIIATGGDTSMQVCKALESKGINLRSEIVPGIPGGKLIGGIADSLYLVTKSGGFGKDDALVNVIKYLESME